MKRVLNFGLVSYKPSDKWLTDDFIFMITSINQFIDNGETHYAFRFQTGGIHVLSDSNVRLICETVRDVVKARGISVSRRVLCIRLIKLALPHLNLSDAKALSESRLFDGAFIVV